MSISSRFPTAWQQVIFRNYNVVPTKKIAKVLNAEESDITREAWRMGLENTEFCKDWLMKGFVTVIRNCWDILSEEQILTLLSIDKKQFDSLLRDYDFLGGKLGEKPFVEPPRYSPLTSGQIAQTEKTGAYIRKIVKKPTAKPFDFFGGVEYAYFKRPEKYEISDRFTSCYAANYLGALLDDDLKDFPDEYLKRLAATGTNGIWLHETLCNLAKFPFDESYSPDYKKRVCNLKKLTERCAEYGVGVYLYLNEPRSLPESFFEKYPDLKGNPAPNGEYCLCTSTKEVQKYLFDAVKSVVETAPLLKGIMTITMSENITHCYSRNSLGTLCPRCAKRKVYEVAAEVNNIFSRAIRSVSSECALIANLWGWAKYLDWTPEMVEKGIANLDKEVDVLCVSESGKTFTRGGVENEVIDYSISVEGPSDDSVRALEYAKSKGHRIWAKIQVNNSWECSAVPYLPVFSLMTEHIKKLKKTGVSGLMLGWSLGGYPGGALPLCNMVCGEGDVDETAWYKAVYAQNAVIAKSCVDKFCEAFKEYPFSVEALYFGGQNMGAGNMWSLNKDERISTMVCFTFDDYERWAKPYGLEIFTSQYAKLCDKWKSALDELNAITGNAAYEELKTMAAGAYIQFSEAYNIALLCKYKTDLNKYRDEIARLIEVERENTLTTYELVLKDARVGYEASNHYFFNSNLLLEKLLNLKELENQLKGENDENIR